MGWSQFSESCLFALVPALVNIYVSSNHLSLPNKQLLFVKDLVVIGLQEVDVDTEGFISS